MDAEITIFSYPWCSVERASRVRELRYKKLSLPRLLKFIYLLAARLTSFNSSFALPHFDYGEINWKDRGNSTLMDDLQVLQNKAARIILDLPPLKEIKSWVNSYFPVTEEGGL